MNDDVYVYVPRFFYGGIHYSRGLRGGNQVRYGSGQQLVETGWLNKRG
jgi:hypothetical protein